jgi:hypothetical protein
MSFNKLLMNLTFLKPNHTVVQSEKAPSSNNCNHVIIYWWKKLATLYTFQHQSGAVCPVRAIFFSLWSLVPCWLQYLREYSHWTDGIFPSWII